MQQNVITSLSATTARKNCGQARLICFMFPHVVEKSVICMKWYGILNFLVCYNYSKENERA